MSSSPNTLPQGNTTSTRPAHLTYDGFDLPQESTQTVEVYGEGNVSFPGPEPLSPGLQAAINPLGDAEKAVHDHFGDEPASHDERVIEAVDHLIAVHSVESDEITPDYNSLSPHMVAKNLGIARARGDAARTEQLSGILEDKMIEQQESRGLNVEEQDKLFDHLMKVTDESADKWSGREKKPTQNEADQQVVTQTDVVVADDVSLSDEHVSTEHQSVPEEQPSYAGMTMHSLAQELARAQVRGDESQIDTISKLLHNSIESYARAGLAENRDEENYEKEYEKALAIANNLQQKEIELLTGQPAQLEEVSSRTEELHLKDMSWRERIAYLKARATSIAFGAAEKFRSLSSKQKVVAIGAGILATGAALVLAKQGLDATGITSGATPQPRAINSPDFSGTNDLVTTLGNKAQRAQELAGSTPGAEQAHSVVMNVNPGDGITNLIQDAALQHGKRLSDAQLYQIYQHHEEVLRQATNSYTMAGGDIGIADPSHAFRLPSEVVEDILKAKSSS